ncbi:MAG TPA: AIR synthase-related protein, partial [Pyrinomonadaceae bacterium]|nr:AIR synthase-related protein [Pyrinomonadaceae bacterium]
ENSLIRSAHDCADGGLAVTIAESCFSSLNRKAFGAEIELNDASLSAEKQLFVESPSRIVISFAPENQANIEQLAASLNCPFEIIGRIGGDNLKIKVNDSPTVSASISVLENIWRSSLENQLES